MKNTGYAVIFACVFLLGNVFLWAISIPYNAAPDESTHCTTPYFIYEHGRLPVFGKDQEATFDPLLSHGIKKVQLTYNPMPYIGYIISAAFMKTLSLADPRYLTFYARLTSILSYAVFAYFVWLFAGRVFGNKSPARYLFPWFVLNIPQVTFLAAYTNNDMISLALGAMVLYSWWALYDHAPGRLPSPVFFGIAAGLLVFARLNYYVLFPLTIAAYILGARNVSRDRRETALWFGKVAGIAFLVCGWSLIRNTLLYGDPLGMKVFNDTCKEIALAPVSNMGVPFGFFIETILPQWSEKVFESGLACFDWMRLTVPPWIMRVFKIGFLVASVGFLRHVFREHSEARPIAGKQWLYVLLAMIFPLSLALSLWSTYYLDYQPQGRYLFPALIPVMAMFCAGWVYFFKDRRYQAAIAVILGAGILAFNLYCLYGIIRPRYKANPFYQQVREMSKEWDYSYYKWK